MNAYEEALRTLDQKFSNKDLLIALSTVASKPGAEGGNRPVVRLVDVCYEDGAFYIVTNGMSNKMLEIAENPLVALCLASPTERGGDIENFTADGIGENLGWVREEANIAVMEKVRRVFAAWYHIANNDDNRNTCLLRIRLTRGLWFDAHKGEGAEINFAEKTMHEIK